MASNYPGSLDSFDAIASDKKTSDTVGGRTHRDMHNDLGDAIEAIEAELGTDPSGGSATVKARLDAIGTVGTGSPEGVVTAAPGSTWLQTDATTDVKGWIRWIKATGTGNTGWVAGPEADTGMRDVSASLLNGWTGSVITRRIGNAVTLWLYGLAAGSDGHALTLPSGFMDAYIATMPFGVQKAGADTGVGLAVGAITWDSKVVLPTSGATNLIGEVHLMTADTWPSSLPGSAA